MRDRAHLRRRTLCRLVAIKKQHDPGDLFRTNHNIALVMSAKGQV
jgi:Berberine and berberine like